jgi:uncharacterized protein involved in type VI secretion and phage assembly
MSGLARSRLLDKRYYGVVEAVVVKVVDDPDKEGRIKIRFEWFDKGTVTEWCRVCQPYAGNGFGAFFVPEEGTEVLVAFVHGDMRRPIILGGLYNGKDKPSSHRTTEQDEKIIRTKAGHQLLLDDSPSARKVRLTTNGNHTVELNDQEKTITVATSNGHKAVFDDRANSITVQSAGGDKLVLDANQRSITLTTTSVTLDASEVKLGSSAAQSLVLGDVFIGLFNAHTHQVGPVPTTPPTVPIIPFSALSQFVKTM